MRFGNPVFQLVQLDLHKLNHNFKFDKLLSSKKCISIVLAEYTETIILHIAKWYKEISSEVEV